MRREMEGEVRGEAVKIAAVPLIEPFSRHVIQPRQVGVEDDALVANGMNQPGYVI